MKLQIISRLTKNQPSHFNSNLQAHHNMAYINTEFTQGNQKINQYYSMNTQGSNMDRQKQNQKNNIRSFFNLFNKVEPIVKDVKRRLEPILESLKKIKTNSTQEMPSSILAESIKQHSNSDLNSWVGQKKPYHLKIDPKHTYYCQRAEQKIRKVNSLISLDNLRSSMNSICSTRKPGFIRLNRSLAKKQSSLQISKIVEYNKQNNFQKEGLQNKRDEIGGSQMDGQINDSKQRIAKIRKQLNEIYQMRNKPGQYKLKLK